MKKLQTFMEGKRRYLFFFHERTCPIFTGGIQWTKMTKELGAVAKESFS